MRIAYVCEGGGRLGWGHVGRGRSVSEASKGRVEIVLGRGFDEIARWCEEHEVQLPLTPWMHPDRPFDADDGRFDLVIVDHYALPDTWLAAIGERTPAVVVDDWMRESAPAAAIVNPNIGARREDYRGHVAEWLLGEEFALIRSEIRDASPTAMHAGRATRLLLTLGGSDPDGRTAQVAEALVATSWYRDGGHLAVILGPSYSGSEPWTSWTPSLRRNLDVVRQPRDYVMRVANSDVVVCGASTTTYELAHLGRPFVPLGLVDNQARVASGWAAAGVGEGICVWQRDWFERLCRTVESLLAPGDARARMSGHLRGLVDGRGALRLLESCERLAAVRSTG